MPRTEAAEKFFAIMADHGVPFEDCARAFNIAWHAGFAAAERER